MARRTIPTRRVRGLRSLGEQLHRAQDDDGDEQRTHEAFAAAQRFLRADPAGGIRVSIYNAMEVAGVEKLIDFMGRFRRG